MKKLTIIFVVLTMIASCESEKILSYYGNISGVYSIVIVENVNQKFFSQVNQVDFTGCKPKRKNIKNENVNCAAKLNTDKKESYTILYRIISSDSLIINGLSYLPDLQNSTLGTIFVRKPDEEQLKAESDLKGKWAYKKDNNQLVFSKLNKKVVFKL